MPGAGFKDFTVGQILTSQEVDEYLMQQSVMRFATTSARDSAIASPSEGMTAYTDDTDTFWLYNGSAWVRLLIAGGWQSWTPTLTNMTLGNGTQSAAYAQVGRTVFVRWEFTLGSTSTVGTDPEFSLPVTSASVEQRSFTAFLQDTGVNAFYGVGVVFAGTPTRVRLQTMNVAGTYPTAAQVTATVPHTWGNTDLMRVFGYYESA